MKTVWTGKRAELSIFMLNYDNKFHRKSEIIYKGPTYGGQG